MPSGFTHESTRNESKEWYTPPYIFERLGIEFDLDPCAPPEGSVWTVPAMARLTFLDDGLMSQWPDGANVFMNPPYGADSPRWMNKLALHGLGVALIFARVDTDWFHRYAAFADAICFIKGRITFLHPDGTPAEFPAGAPSMLVAYGDVNVEALRRSKLGAVMRFDRPGG